MSLISALRSVFTLGKGVSVGLDELGPADDPIGFFHKWFEQAREAGLLMPESMTLATATPDGTPSARMVLLKEVDEDGFVFYTNYGSRKAAELDANPRAALVFHWTVLQRQVRVEGVVERIDREQSSAYFHSRARGSQIGAWASQQSRPVSGRDELERQVREREREFAGAEVPLPDFWGGYRLRPQIIEFWQGRVNRLHDRLVYTRDEAGWMVRRLYP